MGEVMLIPRPDGGVELVYGFDPTEVLPTRRDRPAVMIVPRGSGVGPKSRRQPLESVDEHEHTMRASDELARALAELHVIEQERRR